MAKKLDIIYKQQFDEIATMIRQTHHNVMRMANVSLINLYWEIGSYISSKVKSSEWGQSVVTTLATYISNNVPDVKGFSDKNLWRMKQFYETYSENEKLSPLVREIGWSQNLLIMSQAKTDEEREYYMHLCINEHLSKRELERQISSCLYERTKVNGPKLSTLLREIEPKALQVFKDQYVLEFIDGKEAKPENSLRKALIRKMKNFILELGKDFIFMDEEYKLQVGMSDFRIDLLFFHRELQCLVAFELKTESFKPEHLGQLNFYLEALDRDVKKKNENPSIGVLLCKSKDNEVVEYALSRSLSPTLVAEYQLALPDKNILQKKLKEIAEETNESDNEQ